MSAFVVSDSTINAMVTKLHRNVKQTWANCLIERELGINPRTKEGAAALGQALFDLNVKAVNHRYNGGAEQFRPLDYTYTQEYIDNWLTPLAEYDRWSYQCAEGDVPETVLYKVMATIAFSWAMDVVRENPSWKGA